MISSWVFFPKWLKTASSLIYTYYWDHAPPGQCQGAYHESEVGYIMDGLFVGANMYPYTRYDYYLANVMSSYWANVIKTGNPSKGVSYKHGNLMYWVPNDSRSSTVFHVGQGFGTQAIAEPEQVRLITEYFARQTPYWFCCIYSSVLDNRIKYFPKLETQPEFWI